MIEISALGLNQYPIRDWRFSRRPPNPSMLVEGGVMEIDDIAAMLEGVEAA